jgi:hypothetical protein
MRTSSFHSYRAVITVLVGAFLFATGAAKAEPRVEFKTNQGSFVVDLDSAKAPKTVDNFSEVCSERLLQRHDLSSRDRWLHDPRRRLHARFKSKANQSTRCLRSAKRTKESNVYDCDGQNIGSRFSDSAILYQCA